VLGTVHSAPGRGAGRARMARVQRQRTRMGVVGTYIPEERYVRDHRQRNPKCPAKPGSRDTDARQHHEGKTLDHLYAHPKS